MEVRRNILIVLVVAQMAFIFCMSARDGTRSSGDSLGVTRMVCSGLVADWDEMSVQEQEAAIEAAHGWIRTGAHFGEYAVLGLLMILAAIAWREERERTAGAGLWMPVMVWCAGVLYAVSDEVHQMFVPGRACELGDVVVDAIGVAAGVAVVVLVRRIKRTF